METGEAAGPGPWSPLPWAQVSLATVLGTVAFALLISFSEELAFRGYCLQRIELSLGRRAGGLLSSPLFAVLHLPNRVPLHLSPLQVAMAVCSLSLLGIALAVGFVRTGGSLWSPWALHFAHNLVFSSQGLFFL